MLFIAEVGNFACEKPIGVAEKLRKVQDDKLSSSSDVNGHHGAKFGRLLNEQSAWCARSSDPNGYLEIRLNYTYMIFAVAMQGDPNSNSYVNRFALHVQANASEPMAEKEVSILSRNE